jgi:hypothetical protein
MWGGLGLRGEAALRLEPAMVLLGVNIVGGADFVLNYFVFFAWLLHLGVVRFCVGIWLRFHRAGVSSSAVFNIFCARGKGPCCKLHLRNLVGKFSGRFIERGGCVLGLLLHVFGGRRAHIVYAWVLYSLRRFVHYLARQSNKVSIGVLFEGVLMILAWRSTV